MKLLDFTCPLPEENLALDEALLDAAEANRAGESLRFWQSPRYFVVVGYANQVDREVNLAACAAMGVPIFRRCSGGGTVVQGPGSLNYSLVLSIAAHPELATVPETNRFIMGRHRDALGSLLEKGIEVDGHTDLVWRGRKFSGNAQRRRREFVLFHGTFLLHFDLELIARLLPMPSQQPAYRRHREHGDFLVNLPLGECEVKRALQGAWKAEVALDTVPAVDRLVAERYGQIEWNRKF